MGNTMTLQRAITALRRLGWTIEPSSGKRSPYRYMNSPSASTELGFKVGQRVLADPRELLAEINGATKEKKAMTEAIQEG